MDHVSLSFNTIQTVMKDYDKVLEKERDPQWKRTASKVLTVVLFTLGMIAFLSTSVVGLPGWMVVATFVGWAACTILSTIWMKKLNHREGEFQKNLQMCRIINPNPADANAVSDQKVFKEKFDELVKTTPTYPRKGVEKKILTYCRYIKYESELKKKHEVKQKKVSETMAQIFDK